MLFIDRSDGSRIRGLPSFEAVVPYVVRSRNEAAVQFSKDVEIEGALRYSRAREAEGAGREAPRAGLFGIAVAAAVRTLALKPRLNRFVHRRGLYQRRGISASFLMKRLPGREGDEAIVKVPFEDFEDLDGILAKLEARIAEERQGATAGKGGRLAAVHRLPFGKAFVTGTTRLLDRFNLAPAALLRDDPLFTSIYFANLGSLGLDAPFHQLYEWGTASIFVVMGRVFKKEARSADGALGPRHFVSFKITVDERIAEGSYFAHAASLFQRLLARPELLESRPQIGEIEP